MRQSWARHPHCVTSAEHGSVLMSDMSIVITGVITILSCVAVVTWLARPAEFRSVKGTNPTPPDIRVEQS